MKKKVTFVSVESLEEQDKIKKKNRKRVLYSLFLFLLSALFIAFAHIPTLANKILPIMWVNKANTFGIDPVLHDNILRLVANGRIQVFPPELAIVFTVVGALIGWLAVIVFVYRKDPRWHGGALTLKYWKTFYIIKPYGDINHAIQSSDQKNKPR